MTSPPRPPSPPLGPPRGTNFSRRKARQPLPPSPAFTRMRASSRKCIRKAAGLRGKPAAWRYRVASPRDGGSVPRIALDRGVDGDELAHAPAVPELDHAGHLGEKRVVLAPADIEAGFDPGAALADDDGTAGDQLSAENFHAEPL